MGRLIRRRADLLDSPEEYASEIHRADMWDSRSRQPKPPDPNSPVIADPRKVSRPIRVGGRQFQTNLISQVPPVYPPLAKAAGVTGTVHFRAEINEEGRVDDLRLISGHALLVEAVRDAVKQWVYKPTLLNGSPVKVLTTIDVNFQLLP